MKCTILIEDLSLKTLQEACAQPDIRLARLPYENSPTLVVDGTCPHCKDGEFLVRGDPSGAIRTDDKLYCVAYCNRCTRAVGTLKVEFDTIFGLTEDAAVLNGRPRVY